MPIEIKWAEVLTKNLKWNKQMLTGYTKYSTVQIHLFYQSKY